MADKVPCAESETVEELLRCVSETFGVALPTREDIGNDPMLVALFNMPVTIGEEQPYLLKAEVNLGKPSRWPEFPVFKLKTLAVYVGESSKFEPE